MRRAWGQVFQYHIILKDLTPMFCTVRIGDGGGLAVSVVGGGRLACLCGRQHAAASVVGGGGRGAVGVGHRQHFAVGVVAVVGGDLAEWIGDGADLPTATDTRICQAKVTVGGGVIDVGTRAFDAGEQAIGVVGG